MFTKIAAFFMAIATFFNVLFMGCIKYYHDNRIFTNEYYTAERIKRQTYDLAFPKNASGDLGLVLCIHGGGWIEGSKDEYTKNLFQFCEEKGLAAACINYRFVSEDINYGDELDDISAALAAIKAKGAEYGVNFNKVLLTGGSAGAHLSLLYAYTKKDVAPIEPVCVVELCGPTDLTHKFYLTDDPSVPKAVGTEFFREVLSHGIGYNIDLNNLPAAQDALSRYSPINYIDENTVPTFFGHGEEDTVVPYKNATDLEAKLTKYGIDHEFVSFPNSTHACENKECLSKMMKIFYDCTDKYLK